MNSNIILELWKWGRADNGFLVGAAEQISKPAKRYCGVTSFIVHKKKSDKLHDQAWTI